MQQAVQKPITPSPQETRTICEQLTGQGFFVSRVEPTMPAPVKKRGPGPRYDFELGYFVHQARGTYSLDVRICRGKVPVEQSGIAVSVKKSANGKKEEIRGELVSNTVTRFELPLEEAFTFSAAVLPGVPQKVSDEKLLEQHVTNCLSKAVTDKDLPLQMILDPWTGTAKNTVQPEEADKAGQ